MDINYSFAKKELLLTKRDNDDLHSFLLTNQFGDIIHQSLKPEVCKSFGFFQRDHEKNKLIKVIDFIGPTNVDISKVDIKEFQITKHLSSPFVDSNETIGFEKITISPNGGCMYEVQTDSSIVLDLDVKYFDDYSKWGKEYQIYEEKDILFIEFLKKDEQNNEVLKYYIGIKTQNLQYQRIEEWVEKNYSYDKLRGLDSQEFVFRALSIDILNVHKKIAIGYSQDKEDVFEQLIILDNFEHIVETVEEGIDSNSFTDTKSNIPMSIQTQMAYEIAKRTVFDFVVKDKLTDKNKIVAGYPWFYQEWIRDEVLSLRGFLEIGEIDIVIDKIDELCYSILENKDSELVRINEKGSLTSFDSILFLAKRIEDVIFELDEHNMFESKISKERLELYYNSLYSTFEHIMSTRWNIETELVKIEPGEWWRDTIKWIKYPLALQVATLNLISVLAILAKLLNKTIKCEEFLDLESIFKDKIREIYLRNNMLFDEAQEDIITNDVFLAYYLYPDLCYQEEWESIFEKSLQHLYLNWGGISSLSKFDSRFQENYSGADDISYHQGDSWYFMNALVALSLNHCNSKKFEIQIKSITQNLTSQLLEKGTLGYISEVSSASNNDSRGCSAQLWSHTLYLELLHNLYTINTFK